MSKYIKETIKYILRSYPIIYPYIKEIERMYSMTPEEIKKRNEKVFIKIFRKAYDKSPFYNKLYSAANIKKEDIKSLNDISKLPVITKNMIKDCVKDLLVSSDVFLVKNHTSGTTGKPLTVYEDWPSIWREQAYFYCYRKRCGYVYGKDVIASLRGHLDRKTKALYITNSKTLYLSSFNLNENTIDEYVSKLNYYKPKAIEGYPSSLYNLAKLVEKKGISINIPVAFTSSESLEPNMRIFIERILNTKIYDHYGNTERTIRLEESFDHLGYFEDPGYSINEYREDCIITTSLINRSFPLIRYKVDDILKRKEYLNSNVENNIPPLIESIEGRSSNCIIGKDGTNYSGAALTYLAKVIPNIQVVQLIQERIGYVDINIVPGNNFCRSDEKEIPTIINEIIGLDNIDYKLHIIGHEELEYSKSGKLSLIVNKINK